MITVTGYTDHIIFRNPDNGYTVLKLTTDEGDITLVGPLGCVSEGDLIEAKGDFVYHSGYGEQFSVQEVSLKEPETAEAMLLYLSSGIIKGIGPVLAKRIVDKFGDDTFGIMGREPERLAEIKGISAMKALDIYKSFEEKAGIRRAMMFLQQYGISNRLAVKIYERYHEGLYAIISENPYRITEDISGAGFKTADEIALRVGIERHSVHRVEAGILYVLSLGAGEGSTCLPVGILTERTAELLTVSEDEVKASYPSLQQKRKIEIKRSGEETFVYSAYLYRAERKCAALLSELNIEYKEDPDITEDRIRRIERESGLTLDTDQRNAVISAVMNGVFILTGGPGTGKTTTLRILLKYFMSSGMHVSLTAPTGRAAKRLSEACGMEAGTIHRLLEVSGLMGEVKDGREYGIFGRNKDNPLETDVVIVDEMSMVDITLFDALLSAIDPGTRLIMVGDEHQLPSVGPGSVLKDILSSGCFKSLALKKVFRQAEMSDIIMNAHALLKGEPMKTDNKSRDFFFLERENPEEIIKGIIYLIKEKLPPYLEADPSEIQVLSPQRKGILGVENLNAVLQDALNPPSPLKREINRGEFKLRTGDRVMQNRNNYQLRWVRREEGRVLREEGTGVFNGDMGRIESVDPAGGTVTVRFEDERVAEYGDKELSELELSYAVTIHKSQGSEYCGVIMPILKGPDILMTRNLLYTGITRAKKCVLIMGSSGMVKRMASNTREQERYSGLWREIQRTNRDNDR